MVCRWTCLGAYYVTLMCSMDIGQVRLGYVLVLLLKRLVTISAITGGILEAENYWHANQRINMTIGEHLDYLATTNSIIHRLTAEAKALLNDSA